MRRIWIIFVLLFTPWIGALHAQSGSASPDVQLFPGDRVDVVVWRNTEMSGNFLVANDGFLQHPLYGSVQVVGVPISTAQQRIRQFLEQYVAEPQFVFVPEFRVYVGGNVREQNQFHLPEMSVAQAITRAGGSTAPTRQFRVRLIRDGEERVTNLEGTESAPLLQEPIRSGDQILVEHRPTFTRNYLEPGLRVLQTVTGLVASYVYLNAIFGGD